MYHHQKLQGISVEQTDINAFSPPTQHFIPEPLLLFDAYFDLICHHLAYLI
jgi:hypothetical protein